MIHRPTPGPWLLSAPTTATEARADIGIRVLVIDDDPMVRDIISQLLVEQRFVVDVVDGGGDTFARLASNSYQVVLLDLVMPQISGMDILSFVRERQIDAKVIVLSGDARFQTAKDALLAGAFDFVSKPYRTEALLQVVHRAAHEQSETLARRRLRERVEHSDALLRFVVHSSPDLVFVVDRSGNFVFANERFRSLLGLPPSSLLGSPLRALVLEPDLGEVDRLFSEPAEAGPASQVQSTAGLTTSKPPEGVRHGELRVLNADVEAAERTVVLEISTACIFHNDQHQAEAYLGMLGIGRDVTERRRTLRMVRYRAYHDELTQLPNRGLLEDRLSVSIAQAKRNGHRLAVLFLDLDRFKVVNDFHGHQVGDRLLKAVALRLRACVRRGDTLARYGGDEFTLLLPQVRSAEDVEVLARKILEDFSRPIEIGGHALNLGVSIGIAMLPEAGDTAEMLIQNADLAMYEVKARGKSGYAFFTDELGRQFSTRLSLDRELRAGVDARQFEAHYQPSYSMASGELQGFEALVRWRHPNNGLLLPSEFLPAAEEAGVLVKLDEWVQEEAFAALAAWRAGGGGNLGMAVNVNGAQLEQSHFVARLIERIDAAGVPRSAITVELTEGTLARDIENTQRKLRELRDRGVRIAIDDFGTGLSALSYLQGLPADIIKIDGSFLRGSRSEAELPRLLQAMAEFAKHMGVEVALEGIETSAQLASAHALGLSSAQGFFLGRPAARGEVSSALSRRADDCSEPRQIQWRLRSILPI